MYKQNRRGRNHSIEGDAQIKALTYDVENIMMNTPKVLMS
jgi:hypothetical protein